MDPVTRRVARRHAAVVLRDVALDGDLAHYEQDDAISTCPDGCSVTTADVERLLGYGGARIDTGSVEFKPNAAGEIEIPFTAVRRDGREVRSVLRLVARVDGDGSRVTVYAEVIARL